MELSASEVMQLNLVLVSLFLRSIFTNCCIGLKKPSSVCKECPVHSYQPLLSHIVFKFSVLYLVPFTILSCVQNKFLN